MRNPRRYLTMLVSTAAIAVLGTALVAIDPVQWGRLAGIAVLLAGVGLMGVEMILVNLLQHRERKHVDALEARQTRLGEEFTVVLPGTTTEGAEFLAETIRRDVETEKLTFDGNDLGAINVSIGVATMPDHANTIKELLKAADEALYAAKSGGRNRVMTAEGPPRSGDGQAESRDRAG